MKMPEQGFHAAFRGLLAMIVEHTIIAGEAEGSDNRQMIEQIHANAVQQSLDTMQELQTLLTTRSLIDSADFHRPTCGDRHYR